MLNHFLALPVVVESDASEAYRLAWRPVGARPLSSAIAAAPADPPKRA